MPGRRFEASFKEKPMMSTRRGFVVCALLLLIGLAPVGSQTLFLAGSPEVDRLSAIYREAGRVFPTTSFPVSKAELSDFADDLGAGANAALAAELDEYRSSVLGFGRSHDSISASGSANFEYDYRTRDVTFDPALDPRLEILDVQRLFLNRAPLVSARLDYSRDSGFELGISAKVEREYFLNPFSPTNLWENDAAQSDPVALENQDITRGFLWYDFHPLQVELGRDKIQLGPGKHSLLVSADVPFLDMLRLRLPIGRLTGDLVISTLENRNRGIDVPGDPNGEIVAPYVILMATHRYEYAFDRVRIGIAAMCIYARDGNAFNLGDIFPVFSWHQANIGPNNTVLTADASWAPLPGLALSLQVGLDDINVSGAGVADTGVPTIPAFILNGDYTFGIADSLSMDLGVEVGYTHYLWGNFQLDSTNDPGNISSLARAIDRYFLDGGNAILPLTSPYGPGATWVELTAALHGIRWLDASISARYFSRMTDPTPITGGIVNLVDTPYARSAAIEGAPHVDTWSLGARAGALPFGFFSFSVEPTLYVQIDNRTGIRNAWLELNLGASVHGESVTRISRGN
jgi:hypothetical protein